MQNITTVTSLYQQLQTALEQVIQQHHLAEEHVSIRCKALSTVEAIGTTKHQDYPIITGKEVMIEAEFQGAKGQAFTDEVEQAEYRVLDLLSLSLDSNRTRASFVAGLNAIFRKFHLCEKTVHCKDDEPIQCAEALLNDVSFGERVLLVGFQPRFFETLAARTNGQVRCVDLNQENIGRSIHGVTVESANVTQDALAWCDMVFATGSTLVNGTIVTFLQQNKPIYFYGITISAAAAILQLPVYCHCGH